MLADNTTAIAPTPPPIVRTHTKRSLAASVACDSEFGGGGLTSNGDPDAAPLGPPGRAAATATEAFPPAPPPPGVAAGVRSFHIDQRVVPMAIYPDQQLRLESTDPDDNRAEVQTHHWWGLDFSPSMADKRTGSALALASTMRALPKYLRDLLPLLPPKCRAGGPLEPTLSIAGFSNACGWEDDDEWLDGDRPVGREGARNVGTLERVKANTFLWSDPRLAAACETWAAHLESIHPPEGSIRYADAPGVRGHLGESTNIDAAVAFGTEALRALTASSGGYGLALIATDGIANVGRGSATEWLRTFDSLAMTEDQEEGRRGLPVSFSALMMGSDPQITSLSKLTGKRGVLGYAAKAENIQEGLDSILRARILDARGGFDVCSLAVLVGEDGKPLAPASAYQPIPYSRQTVSRLGLYAGDNYEAFFDVRVPDAPEDRKDVRGMKVISVAIPSLCHDKAYAMEHHTARLFEACLLVDAGERLLDAPAHVYETTVPLHEDPSFAHFFAHPNYERHASALVAPQELLHDVELEVVSPLDNVYAYVRSNCKIEEDAYKELNRATTHAEAAAVADRFALRSLASGSQRMAKRFRSLRREATVMQERADAGDDEAVYRSAPHSAAAALSQSLGADALEDEE